MKAHTLESRPSLARLYARAVASARSRRGETLPSEAYEMAGITVDREHLARYAQLCGFHLSDRLPPTYPHLLAFPLAVSLMVDPAFPFPLPGLVHVANRITQRAALTADDRLGLRVHATNLRPHSRGRQFEVISEASSGGEVLWDEASTYLHIEKPSSSGPRPKAQAGSGPAERPSALWRLRADLGRRYAAVSGDVNPIHLNPLAARLFGFRRSIAHGMWLKARCLAALEGRLPEALTAEVEFKSPVLLPSTVAFAARSQPSGWSIEVFQPASGRRHLIGSIA
jgi:acyl dehydratase